MAKRLAQKGHGIVSTIGQAFAWERPVEKTSLIALLFFTVAALATRFYRISKGDFVVYHATASPPWMLIHLL